MLRSISSWFMAVGQGHGHGRDFIMEFPWVTLIYGNPLSRKHSRVDYGFRMFYCSRHQGPVSVSYLSTYVTETGPCGRFL